MLCLLLAPGTYFSFVVLLSGAPLLQSLFSLAASRITKSGLLLSICLSIGTQHPFLWRLHRPFLVPLTSWGFALPDLWLRPLPAGTGPYHGAPCRGAHQYVAQSSAFWKVASLYFGTSASVLTKEILEDCRWSHGSLHSHHN